MFHWLSYKEIDNFFSLLEFNEFHLDIQALMLTSKLQQLTTKKSTEWRNKRDMLLSVVSLNSSPLNIFERKNNKKKSNPYFFKVSNRQKHSRGKPRCFYTSFCVFLSNTITVLSTLKLEMCHSKQPTAEKKVFRI